MITSHLGHGMLGRRHVTVAFYLIVISALARCTVDARQFTADPYLPDTFAIGTAFAEPGRSAYVPLFVTFDEPLAVLEVTIKSYDTRLVLDSVSFKSGAFLPGICHWIRLTPQALAVVVVPPSGELLSPHSGLLGRVHMTPVSGLVDTSVVLDTVTYVENFLEHTTYFSDSAFRSFRPVVVSGLFVALPQCCQGTRGNIDNSPDGQVDISDLSVLIGYLYLGNQVNLPCYAEADLDQPADDVVDISDLSLLIDYLYIHPGQTPLPLCP